MKILSKKLYLIGTVILAALICFTIILIYNVTSKKSSSIAADDKVTVTVNKINTVSIYVSGDNVKKLDSNLSKDIYEVDKGSTVVLRSVNESRLFVNWEISSDENNNIVNNSNTPRINLTVNENITVSTNRKDPIISDLGKYMDNPFVISEESHMMYLQYIFDKKEGKTVTDESLKDAYHYFFQNDNEYKMNVIDKNLNAADAVKYLVESPYGYFDKIQNGYYKVQQSFTVLNTAFRGIGSSAFPFKGVICGSDNSNTDNAQIFTSINVTETNNDMYCGLFGSIDENAVIRNLTLKSSVAVAKGTGITKKQAVYMGGVAGTNDNALLSNIKVSTMLSANTANKDIYAGGIAGKMTGGINEHHNVSFDFSNQSWVLTSNVLQTNIYGGIIAGYGDDVFIHKAEIDVSNFAINSKNIETGSFTTTTNLYIGNLFGYYKNTNQKLIDNITITGNNPENIHSIVSNGSSYVGGLIGYVEVTNNPLLIGNVTFNMNTKSTSQLFSESSSSTSKANIYAGGLFAYVNGTNLLANNEFKEGVTTIVVDETTVNEYHFIFDTPMEILAKQHGIQPNNDTYGHCISGGLVGEGYFNINGDNTKRAKILVSSGNNKFSVQSVQSSSSSHENTASTNFVASNDLKNSIKHCLSSLLFGYLDEGNDSTTNYSFEYIDVYANNANVEAVREIGSRSLGDLSASGFLSYAKNRSFRDITMYLGESTSIMANSLSYEVGYVGNGNLTSANNNYVSAFVSHIIGTYVNNNEPNNESRNIEINGFDFNKKVEVGADVLVQGIQNSLACTTSTPSIDYSNENYVGGVIGSLKGYYNLNNVFFIGNDNRTSKIFMQGHRDPNSAFVGGIVGFSKLLKDDGTYTPTNQKLSNCYIKNASVIGNATINSTIYGHPDIYAGGIVGACYADYVAGTMNINNSKVLYTDIDCTGNERTEAYAGGVIGTFTWNGNITVSDSYVYKSKVNATVDATQKINKSSVYARSGGILCELVTGSATIENCVVIDTEIYAKSSSFVVSYGSTIAAGICTKTREYNNQLNITRCYTNSKLFSYGGTDTAIMYTTAPNVGTRVYYTSNNKLNNTTYDIGNELDFTKESFDGSNQKTVRAIFGNLNNNDAGVNKFYLKILNGNFTFGGGNVTRPSAASTSEAEVWINAKDGGDTTITPTTPGVTEEELINSGWFKLGNILLTYGNNTGGTSEIDYFKTSYGANNETSNDGYVENRVNEVLNVTTKLNSKLPFIKITFNIDDADIYYINWYKKVGDTYTKVIMSDSSNLGYGSYTYNYKTINNGALSTTAYELIYSPNIELEDDASLVVVFSKGSEASASNYASKYIVFDLIANKYVLSGVSLASYTPALNPDTNENLGSSSDPWHFQVDTSYRLIPILGRKNEPSLKIISELYTQEVSYELNGTDTDNSIRSNGELTTTKVSSNTTTYSVTVSLKSDTTSKVTIYFKVADKYTVSINTDGANYSGLPFATNISDYYVDLEVLPHCGGIPSSVTLKINNNTINENVIKGWLYDKKGNKLTDWDNNLSSYQIRIPDDNINGNISINISFSVNFTVEFHIQTNSFNPSFGETNPLVYKFKVAQGTTFKTFFDGDTLNTINTWVHDATNASFGYLFTGFYLIEDSSSISSYGQSFDKIRESDLIINTSYVFYARWSFLIELIEAPGTHIVTSFNQDFLYEVKQEENEGLLNKNVIIPINNNRGYVFTIVKDKNFIGEADVEAYIINEVNKIQQITEIPIEKYHNNMYLYYIKPEYITGYLVISTKISNSEIIVGENTASITEEVVPEDGIYTYKYIANHKKNETYIYKGYDETEKKTVDNLLFNRNLKLEFKKQIFNSSTNKTEIVPRTLVNGTVIEVYYNKYVNSSTSSSETIVGRYVVTADNVSQIFLTDFNNFDGNDKAFREITYKDLLGDYESLSEIYYFVVIPPNGYNRDYEYNNGMNGEYHNEYLYVGYCNDENNFISGTRSNTNFTNIPIQSILESQLRYESSLQAKQYSITPSRTTTLKNDNTNHNKYHFIDDNKFKIFDVTIENGLVNSANKVIFNNSTIITSSKIDQGINKLKLNLGYNLGEIVVSGSIDNITFNEIETINVNNVLYQDYIVEFPQDNLYQYFKIEKKSLDEIRLSTITLVVNETGMSYDLEFLRTNFDTLYIPNFINRNINSIDLPQLSNLLWSISKSSTDTLSISNNVLYIGSRSNDDITVTLTASYTHNNRVDTKDFEITIQGNNSKTLTDLDKLQLPYEVIGSFLLPTYNGLSWNVSSNATINDNVVSLTGESGEVTLTATLGTSSKTFTVQMTQNSSTYSLEKTIIGDTRHDSMNFILVVQFKDASGEIVTDIQNVSITVNGKTYNPIIAYNGSQVVVYFNLTMIKDELGTTNFDLIINPATYSIYAVQLIEAENEYKPSMGEIRNSYSY